MRRKKNITLNLKNITPHFTGKEKIMTLVFIIIMLSFANIINTSALSYSSSVGIGFTFNPTLSVSISPSDLIIPSLTPGTTADSNNIIVSVATNAAYGYTLSAMMNGNNNDLTHANGTNVFSGIATDSSLSNLVTDNTWGYSYKLSNDTNWNNYSGLSTETSKTLVDSNDQTAIPIDFKIGAKAASTQASGTYTGVINFTAVTKHIPVTLAEAYASEGKTMVNGFYTMQDMTSTICNKVEAIGAQLQVLDKRDNKLYWIAKLADNNCWMTQNLDLDLDSNRTYTHWDTDLGWNDPDNLDENTTWKPIHSTINFTGTSIPEWVNSNTEPYSANPGDIYFYTSNSNVNDTQYNSLQECVNATHSDCIHYHAGNYYNWNAAAAFSNTDNTGTNNRAPNSICPTGWRLPNTSILNNEYNEFGKLFYEANIIVSINSNWGINYKTGGLNMLRSNPYYFIRSGYTYIDALRYPSADGDYWSSIIYDNDYAYSLFFGSSNLWPAIRHNNYGLKDVGRSLRCIAR